MCLNNTITKQTPNINVRAGLRAIEDRMLQMPGVMIGDCFPLKHTFVDGAYVREITMPKGALLTSKIHKITHPYFVLKGEVSVLTEEGVVRIKAPFSGVTKAGTKRLLYIHEETVWTTIHVTKETDLEKIEAEIIAKDYDELENEGELMIERATLITQNCLIKALMAKGRDFLGLFELKPQGHLLPFKEALSRLNADGVSLEGLYTIIQGDNLWHIVTDNGIPLNEVILTDSDMVGAWVAIAVSAIVIGTVTSAVSAAQQASARASTANLNRLIMEGNAKLTTQRMGIEKTLTDVEVQRHRDRTRRILGAQRAQYGKAGVVGGTGTALIVAVETAADAELDAMAIELGGDIEQSRLLAERAGFEQEASLQSMMGRQARIEGAYGVGKSVLTGITKFAGALGK